jgi:hypothetical protein
MMQTLVVPALIAEAFLFVWSAKADDVPASTAA